MFCSQCGATINDTARFCLRCGAKVTNLAPNINSNSGSQNMYQNSMSYQENMNNQYSSYNTPQMTYNDVNTQYGVNSAQQTVYDDVNTQYGANNAQQMPYGNTNTQYDANNAQQVPYGNANIQDVANDPQQMENGNANAGMAPVAKEPLNVKALIIKIIAIIIMVFPLVRGFTKLGSDSFIGMGICNIIFSLLIIASIGGTIFISSMDDELGGFIACFFAVIIFIINSIGMGFSCNDNIFYGLLILIAGADRGFRRKVK